MLLIKMHNLLTQYKPSDLFQITYSELKEIHDTYKEMELLKSKYNALKAVSPIATELK